MKTQPLTFKFKIAWVEIRNGNLITHEETVELNVSLKEAMNNMKTWMKEGYLISQESTMVKPLSIFFEMI